MTPQEVVQHYGTQIKAAAEIGVTEQSIKNWVKAEKMPRIYQLAVQTLTKGKLKADDK